MGYLVEIISTSSIPRGKVLDKIFDTFVVVGYHINMEQESIQKLEQQIEDLAIAVKGGFDAVDQRFDAVDQRFDKIEATLQTQYPDKRYLDEKLADLAAEIGMRITQRKERDNRFKLKIIDIFKRASLTTEDEIKFLENLID